MSYLVEDPAESAEWEALKQQCRAEDAASDRRDERLGWAVKACLVGAVFLAGLLVGLYL